MKLIGGLSGHATPLISAVLGYAEIRKMSRTRGVSRLASPRLLSDAEAEREQRRLSINHVMANH